jgi:hypothetical protein
VEKQPAISTSIVAMNAALYPEAKPAQILAFSPQGDINTLLALTIKKFLKIERVLVFVVVCSFKTLLPFAIEKLLKVKRVFKPMTVGCFVDGGYRLRESVGSRFRRYLLDLGCRGWLF